MCNPMIAVAAMSLAGSAMQMQAQNKAINKQQQILSAAEETQNRRQTEQQGLVLEEAMKFDPAARSQAMEATAQNAEASLGSAVAAANAAAPQNDAGATGRVAEDYRVAQANSVASQTEKAAQTARLMSRLRAPTDLLGNEQLDYADMLSRVGTVGSKAKGEWSRDMGTMNRVRPNGGSMLLGDALKAGGTMFGAKAMSPSGV